MKTLPLRRYMYRNSNLDVGHKNHTGLIDWVPRQDIVKIKARFSQDEQTWFNCVSWIGFYDNGCVYWSQTIHTMQCTLLVRSQNVKQIKLNNPHTGIMWIILYNHVWKKVSHLFASVTFAIQINVTAATTVISRGFFPVNKHKNRLYVYTTLILSQYATDKSVDNPREDKFSLASWWKYKYIRSSQSIYRNYRVIGLKDIWINVSCWLEQTDTREHRKETWEKSSFATGIMVNGFFFQEANSNVYTMSVVVTPDCLIYQSLLFKIVGFSTYRQLFLWRTKKKSQEISC